MRKHFFVISVTATACFCLIVGIVIFFLGTNSPRNLVSKPQSQQQLSNSDSDNEAQDTSTDNDEELPAATPIPVSASDVNNEPQNTAALGGYNVLIADRGNNRLIEVTPDKKIIWEYDFTLPKLGLGADDSFFTDNGKSIIVNLEEYHVIQIIDYATKKVIWTYGIAGKPGNANGMLNTPDDAYKLPNGDVIVADIKNCRVLEISPEMQIVRQYGQTSKCGNTEGLLNKPNGDTPLPNGHVLISNIIGRDLVELDDTWRPVFTMSLPVKYPSDPQLTQAGNILISDYSKPGQIVEVSKQGNIVWQFDGQDGDVKLNHPSLAIELPNGNILANDDLNHRVIVIDKKSKKIIWQYGVTGKPGSSLGQLNIPDGLDIIASSPVSPPLAVGTISRHPENYINKVVTVTGYVLEQQNGYAIFSDENVGAVGPYDLPVVGIGAAQMINKQKYILEGVLNYHSLTASNNNPYDLEITIPPVASQ